LGFKKMKYKISELTKEQEKIKEQLIEQGKNDILAHVLALRNYSKIQKLIPYNQLHDIDKAVLYLAKAIINKTKICVVADYDVDGATSCSIMVKGLRGLGADVNYFVPNRFIHGYGLQPSVVDDMLLSYPDVEMIVTVDNGISSIDGIDYAKSLGIDTLVTDHHLEGSDRPDALVIINPNKKDCTFPSKALAGCGVAFYLIHAIRDFFVHLDFFMNNEEFEHWMKKEIIRFDKTNVTEELVKKAANYRNSELLDYLAIGTIADVVSLDENNRLIVESGLNWIHRGKACIGVKALLKVLKIDETKMNSTHIAFNIAPVINAAGRMEDMGLGIKLLLCNDEKEADELANVLVEINQARKDKEKEMKDDALAQLGDIDTGVPSFSCVVFGRSFHEGIIGILASRIKEQVYLPTIVFSELEEENGEICLKGSGRSIPEIHLRDAIDYVYKKCPDAVVKFGGHAMAAGLTIRKQYLDEFKRLLDEYCKDILNGVRPQNVIVADMDIDWNRVDFNLVEELDRQVWGQNFRQPVFYSKLKLVEQKVLKDAHLRMMFEKPNGEQITGMYFFHNEEFELGEHDVLFKLNINDFRGNRSIQILIDAVV
jgi:single-stranded-DNA-specific exonuclease recJ